MKRKTGYFLFLLMFCFNSFSHSQIIQDSLDTSQLYKILNENFLSQWRFQDDGQKITIKYKKPVWVLSDNKVNAGFDGNWSEQQEEERVKKYGQEIYLHIYLDYEKKWPQEEIEKVKKQNQKIYDGLTQLEKNLNLNNRDRKTGEWIAHSAEEAVNLKTFEKEKKKRLQLIKKIPDYHVGGVSLYYREDSYFDESMWAIWPGSLKEGFFKSIQNFKLALQRN